mmetsp:Transcript_7718/g.15290  ORF Transcript_7718/g.15290 Transcript_7718/m.15290 type:complete len:90 (+) Transcript_7718:300-569(+)
MANLGLEMECEAGVCANRAVQRGRFAPTESQWYGEKGWGLKLVVDVKRDKLVEEYVGEVIEQGEFWDRFQRANPCTLSSLCMVLSSTLD